MWDAVVFIRQHDGTVREVSLSVTDLTWETGYPHGSAVMSLAGIVREVVVTKQAEARVVPEEQQALPLPPKGLPQG